jgi:hypothetical protein
MKVAAIVLCVIAIAAMGTVVRDRRHERRAAESDKRDLTVIASRIPTSPARRESSAGPGLGGFLAASDEFRAWAGSLCL